MDEVNSETFGERADSSGGGTGQFLRTIAPDDRAIRWQTLILA